MATNYYIKRKESLLRLFILTLYITAIVVLACFHQANYDEIRAWEISLHRPVSILGHMINEGHFSLWHFSLYPFSHLGVPSNIGLPLVSCLYMVAAAWVLIYRSRFSTLCKVLILFCCGSLFEFPVVSRCYAMVPLALWLTAYVYPLRQQWPIRYGLCLGFIFNTHLYMEGLGLALLAAWCWETYKDTTNSKRVRKGIAVAIALGFVAFIQVAWQLIKPSSIIGNMADKPEGLLSTFYYSMGGTYSKLWNFVGVGHGDTPYYIVSILLMVVFIALFIWTIRGQRKVTAMVLTGVAYLVLFALLFYFCSVQRAWLVMFMLFFGLWIADASVKRTTVFLLFMFVVGLRSEYLCIYEDLTLPGGHAIARQAIDATSPDNRYVRSDDLYSMKVMTRCFGCDTVSGIRFGSQEELYNTISTDMPASFTVIDATDYEWYKDEPDGIRTYDAFTDSVTTLGYHLQSAETQPIHRANIFILKYRKD